MQEIDSVNFLSKRVAGLKPSGIRKFFDIAATMKDVISLGIGEPDFTTPEPILQAGVRSLQHGETHYTSNWGKLELRQAISDNLSEALRLPRTANPTAQKNIKSSLTSSSAKNASN